MITLQDKELLAKKGISEEQIAEQLACFEKGFPYLKLSAAASVEQGILAPDADEQKKISECVGSIYSDRQNGGEVCSGIGRGKPYV